MNDASTYTLGQLGKDFLKFPAKAGIKLVQNPFNSGEPVGIIGGALGAVAGITLSAGITTSAISTYEVLASDLQTQQVNSYELTNSQFSPVSCTTLILGAIHPALGVGYHAMTREPETTTTIEGTFSGPETTTFTPIFREGQEPFVQTRTATVDYTCSKKGDDWTIRLSENLGSFNEEVKKSLEEHCEDIYKKVNQ